MSLKIAQFEFLLAFYSNYGHILYHFRDKSKYCSKITISSTPERQQDTSAVAQLPT